MENILYSYIMRGELTKVALEKTPIVSKHSSSEVLVQKHINSLSLDLLDDEQVNAAKLMATVYTAIAAFENTVRQFIVRVLLEHKGENWWNECVSTKTKEKDENRKKDEEKIKCHTSRGDSLINYTEFGDLASIMSQNYDLFEVHIVSIDWARQIFQHLNDLVM